MGSAKDHDMLMETDYLYSSVDGATCEQAMLYDTTNLVRLVQHNEGSLGKSLALALGRVSVTTRASDG